MLKEIEEIFIELNEEDNFTLVLLNEENEVVDYFNPVLSISDDCLVDDLGVKTKVLNVEIRENGKRKNHYLMANANFRLQRGIIVL